MSAEPFLLVPGLGPGALVAAEPPLLNEAAAHYLSRVRRLRPGAHLALGDGSGGRRRARVLTGSPLTLCWLGEAEYLPFPSLVIELCLAAIEPRDLEAAVQASVEAGADRLCIYRAERSQRPPPEPHTHAYERLERIVRASAEQSRRPWLPGIRLALDLGGATCHDAQIFFGDPRSRRPLRVSSLATDRPIVQCFVGPEGGFTPEESGSLRAAGAEPVWLGPATLRARTAAPILIHDAVVARQRAQAAAS